MSYPEYTSCTDVNTANDHRKESTISKSAMLFAGVSAGLLYGTAYAFIAALAARAAWFVVTLETFGLVLFIGFLYIVLRYCNWWLQYRLICLDSDNDHCVIGFVASVDRPELKTNLNAFDTDFSLNIGILGTSFGDSDLDAVSGVKPFGYLVKDERENDFKTLNFPLTGVNAFDDETDHDDKSPYFGKPNMKVVHAEFEGGGVYTLRKWIIALIWLLTAVAALTIACHAGLLWACLLAWFLFALFAAGVPTGIQHALGDKANPGDIDKALGTLSIGNIVLIRGRWVYDAGHVDDHTGWNEIHPIRYCQIIYPGVFDGDWAKYFPFKYDEWCHMVSDATSGAVGDEQQKPENGWEIHPLIDGCNPSSSGPFHPR
jgi:hypothetical protein